MFTSQAYAPIMQVSLVFQSIAAQLHAGGNVKLPKFGKRVLLRQKSRVHISRTLVKITPILSGSKNVSTKTRLKSSSTNTKILEVFILRGN